MIQRFKDWLFEQSSYSEHHTFIPMKARIPTTGHAGLVETGKKITSKHGGSMSIGLSGAAKPLSIQDKTKLAEKTFGHKVETGSHVNGIVPGLIHLHKSGVKHLHVVCGSDRVDEYKNLVSKYNGKPDKKGVIPFHFDSVTVHKHGADRNEGDVDKHPSEMNDAEKAQTVSASRIEKYANDGDHKAVQAYYPSLKSHEVKKLVKNIQAGSQ